MELFFFALMFVQLPSDDHVMSSLWRYHAIHYSDVIKKSITEMSSCQQVTL